jgi:DUF971 family protein
MPIPSKIHLHRQSNQLELQFDETVYCLSAEYLRVYSPSAEVKGHGVGQEVLQVGKMQVAIKAIQAQGNYAICLVFDDGHDSGIYTWNYLYELATHFEQNWQDYLTRLDQAGQSRDPAVSAVRLML